MLTTRTVVIGFDSIGESQRQRPRWKLGRYFNVLSGSERVEAPRTLPAGAG